MYVLIHVHHKAVIVWASSQRLRNLGDSFWWAEQFIPTTPARSHIWRKKEVLYVYTSETV